jgi:hypothetical protein
MLSPQPDPKPTMSTAEIYYVAWDRDTSAGVVFLSHQKALDHAVDPLRVLKTEDPVRAANFAQKVFKKVSVSVKRLNKQFIEERRGAYKRKFESRFSDMRRNHGHR